MQETVSLQPHEDSALGKVSGQFLNLEQVLLIEDKLHSMMEGLRQGHEIASFCDEYWRLSEACDIAQVPELFRDLRTQRVLRCAQVLEVVAVGLLNFFICVGGANEILMTHLKNLIFYVHQNFLSLMEYILLRIHPESSKNMWAFSLQETLSNKRLQKKLEKGQLGPLMRQQSEIIANISRGIATTLLSTQKTQAPIFLAVLHVLRTLDSIPIKKAKAIINGAAADTLQALPPPAPVAAALPNVTVPYLPPTPQNVHYTLVLDLDETLVHYFEGENQPGSFKVRPHCERFLKETAELYEVVIFTAAMQDVSPRQYADWVLDRIDPGKLISYRLYRQHTKLKGTVFLKDLSLLGRDLARTIIVDNVAENFQLHPENGIFARSWFDDMSDHELLDLLPLLKGKPQAEMARYRVKDLRVALRQYRDQMLRSAISKADR